MIENGIYRQVAGNTIESCISQFDGDSVEEVNKGFFKVVLDGEFLEHTLIEKFEEFGEKLVYKRLESGEYSVTEVYSQAGSNDYYATYTVTSMSTTNVSTRDEEAEVSSSGEILNACTVSADVEIEKVAEDLDDFKNNIASIAVPLDLDQNIRIGDIDESVLKTEVAESGVYLLGITGSFESALLDGETQQMTFNIYDDSLEYVTTFYLQGASTPILGEVQLSVGNYYIIPSSGYNGDLYNETISVSLRPLTAN